MRVFLQDYRPNIVGLLKRYNGFSKKVSPESKQVLDKIVDAYVALMSMAGFVEVSLLALCFKHFADIYSTRRKARWAVGRMVSHRFLGVKFHGHEFNPAKDRKMQQGQTSVEPQRKGIAEAESD
jgi:hypothetical protein